MKTLRFTIIYFILYLLILPLVAQDKIDTLTYSRQEVLIPMRDGIRLNTLIYIPLGVKEAVPILFSRTPYGVSWLPSPNDREPTSELAKEGYIFVFQDVRGRYKSEGTFKLQIFLRDKKDPKAVDESTDAFDAIEWLIHNIPGNNGRVGMFGASAVALNTMISTIDPHPALKAASEEATPADAYIGDDFYHNGAFRLSYSFEYAYFVDFSKENSLFPFDMYDTYDWYLQLGPLSNVNEKYFHSNIPSWNNFVTHPNYDDMWQKQSLVYYLGSPTIPILHVAGWWDQEDFYGPLKAYEALEKNDLNNQNFIIIGPWNHGGWRYGKGDSLGKINFGTSTAEKFRKDIQTSFFAYYLKGQGNNIPPEAMTFQTGSNLWKTYNKWPPVENIETRNLYFKPEGKLSFNVPKESETFDEYLSDPFHPIPYRTRPIEPTYGPGSRWYTWLVEDQRFVDNRPDVASWVTDTLTEDIEVTGNLIADIFASTTGTDADWVVKLIDVYPEIYPEYPEMGGYQLMIANDVFRGRFRNSYSVPEPVNPDEVYEYKIDLHSINHVFKTGHRIMVQIQSTWFPIIDRNPQKFVSNIFEAKETDFIKTQQRVFRSSEYPSHIKLPIVKK
jgi:putative CocE/NonD family hydrolase